MDADERATLNYDCNYNLFLAKRLIRDVRKSQERNSAVEWLRYLMGANKSIEEMQLRNDFLHYLVQNLQEGSLRPPFDVPPLTGGPLANIAHLIPSRNDYTVNLGENLSDESSSVENHDEKPLVMDLSPDGGEFLALQPIPREGSFCYLAITAKKQTKRNKVVDITPTYDHHVLIDSSLYYYVLLVLHHASSIATINIFRGLRLVTKRNSDSTDLSDDLKGSLNITSDTLREYNNFFPSIESDFSPLFGNGDSPGIQELDFWKEKSVVGDFMFPPEEDMEYSTAKSPQDFNSTLSITEASRVVKVLLVFPRDDQQVEVLATAARKLGWNVTVAKNAEKAIEHFQTRCHDLVIIDHRGQRGPEGDSICRAIRNTNCHHSSVILALVKKSFFTVTDKDELVTLDLLNTGFSRAMMECSHEVMLSNQLVGIYASEIGPRMQLAAAHALYVAVDRCRDMVHVTDDQHVVKFVNKASERLLGYKFEEMLGKNLSEIITCENFAVMDQQLQRGREFEGNMNCRRKFNDTITINCRIVPFCAAGVKPSHYIYVHDTMYLLENMGVAGVTLGGQHPRGSLHSLRRGSFDVKSIGSDIGTARRSSLQKLNSLPLEAPITKVMTLLTSAMSEITGTHPEMAMQIDKAIETLKTTELYRPYLREDTKIYNDPVASDLIEALLSKSSHYIRDSRRSSNDSIKSTALRMLNVSSSAARLHSKNPQTPNAMEELLERSLDWEFDIFNLEVLSGRRPLVHLGTNLMCLYHVPARLGCDEKTLHNWLTVIEYNYHLNNSYHNSTHAADVLQATAKFMQSERLKMMLDPLDEVAALIAAAAHDVDHPGKSSQFLCNSDNKLAILYNDLSVLESHHAALTFKLTLADDNVNIFKNLERDTYKIMRENVIDMILATEMTKHFEHLAKFVNVCSSRVSDAQNEYFPDALDVAILLQPENVTLVKIMMIKCADVSNPTRPLRCCIEWAKRIAEEYFSQTDEEKKKRLPVLMPMFDRMTCSIPKSQIGFVDYIINDMIEAWDAFIDMPEMVTHMRHNYDKWKEYHEQGISTLGDIERLQTQPELKVPRLP